MLSSIHPLGERARHNRWERTAIAFTIGAVAAGAAVGALAGTLGMLVTPAPSSAAPVVLGVAAVVAALLDLTPMRPPGPDRQVNERWIGTYRDWVYGGAYGVQLGSGLATYVVTWGVWLTLLAAVLSASPAAGAGIGVAFGVGRSLPVVGAGWIDRPSRLVNVTSVLARLARPVWRGVAGATAVAGVLALTVGVV